MKERPILFNGPMVRAILDGRKTQTRRVVKPQPRSRADIGHFGYGMPFIRAANKPVRCPYGQPGDRLWVRETWQYFGFSDEGEPCICYLADHGRAWPHVPQSEADKVDCIWADLSEPGNFSINDRACDNRWRPSIHMPRWASRIALKITGVRLERLQEISYEDALAEGAMDGGTFCEAMNPGSVNMIGETPDQTARRLQWPQRSFSQLWEPINGAGRWDANPWVWVVEFKRVKS